MAILDVLQFPDERLRTVAKPIDDVNSEIKQLVADMFETMREEKGIGLAATQVNRHVRLVVMDVSEEQNEPRVFINPEIVNKEGSTISEEGCLSVPDQFAEIDRPSECDVEYLDYNGEKQLLKAEGLLATCIQHEMDHLEGILFIDYLSKLKRSMIIKKLSKLKSNTAIFWSPVFLSNPKAKAAAVGSLIILLTSKPAIFPASLVACLCESLK